MSSNSTFEESLSNNIVLFNFVTDPKTRILGSSEVFLSKGSTLNLTCVITGGPQKQPYIIWTHDSKVNLTYTFCTINQVVQLSLGILKSLFTYKLRCTLLVVAVVVSLCLVSKQNTAISIS